MVCLPVSFSGFSTACENLCQTLLCRDRVVLVHHPSECCLSLLKEVKGVQAITRPPCCPHLGTPVLPCLLVLFSTGCSQSPCTHLGPRAQGLCPGLQCALRAHAPQVTAAPGFKLT